MSDKVIISEEDLNRMIGMALPHRDRLVDEMTKVLGAVPPMPSPMR